MQLQTLHLDSPVIVPIAVSIVNGALQIEFSLDVGGGAEKVLGDLGREFAPASSFSPAIRFSMAPDGKRDALAQRFVHLQRQGTAQQRLSHQQ